MWFSPAGTEMTDDEWHMHYVRSIGLFLSGRTMDVRDEQGRLIEDDSFLILLNAHHAPMPFVLPGRRDARWDLELDTALDNGEIPANRLEHQGSSTLLLVERSLCVLKLSRRTSAESMLLLT